MFCVKLYDVDSAAAACKPLLGPDTVVISFLNGIDSEARIAAVLGADHVAGGVAQIPAIIREPGVIQHMDRFAALQFGEIDGRQSARLEAFLAACRRADVKAELVGDIEAAIWAKFIMLASFAAVCCLTRQPAKLLKTDADVADLFRRAVAEIAALAAAKGVRLPADIGERIFAARETFGDGVKPSMLNDLERGRRIELEGLSGAVARLGRELGVDTPVHRVAYAALKPYLDGAPA
jgi:2-dehydropantoate 2-reductase